MTSLFARDFDVDESQKPTSVPRRIAASIVLLIGLVLLALFGYGAVNPRHYVFLLTYFNNPFGGVTAILAVAVIAYWLAFPIRSTVIDRRRSLTRTTLLILTAISAIVFLFVYELAVFHYSPEVVTTSKSGRRSVARIEMWKNTQMHVYVGTGLGRRDVGSLGAPCGLRSQMSARFVDENEIVVDTAYNTYDIHLEVGTGRPLNVFGASCSG